MLTVFRDIIQTLGRIRNGRFDKRVQVFSNDEIGYTGDAINEMTKGLIERERMQLSLNLAKEVQQNLLPKSNLKVNGFDIAGKSVYCDETGGFSNGQIIFLSTDGIWEARNKKGEMLGKEPILNAIRQNASSDATQIIDVIFDILDKFIGEMKIEDDITSVIIKMQH
ncbi:SpoIIE family protein phosphatase [Thermodesulfobacteriota bacterium]